ncbi:hypothetical protein HNO84_18780 [Herbaspirillum robiniae]|uniref:Uncharacterized protein n=1 Tax=Herbaspirillum robiniae TaxID=2014887 RepID=A0A246WTE1_9BURK|nr:hypothetical protein [Herbaspirillum robiniae]OWY30292.1 hypothetical protein CEJ42_05875 [Herbaspirillum robiniae]
MPVAQQLNARFGVNYFDYSFHTSTNDINYDAKAKLRTFDALLDWFPFANEFRLSGGVIYNGNKVDATGTPKANGTYTINGNTYTASQAGQVDGRIDFKKFAPYLGLGYGNALAPNKGWGFTADVGVMFQGNGSTSVSNSGCTASALICTQLARDVAAENAELNDKVHGYNLYPVVRLGVSYKF